MNKGVVTFLAWMVFAFALFQAIAVSVDWFERGRGWPTAWEALWLALLPVLVGVYFRFFSLFGCSTERCSGTAPRDRSARDSSEAREPKS